MFLDSKNKDRLRSLFVRAVEGFSSVSALVITFFATPMLTNWSHSFVGQFTVKHYSPDLLAAVELAWLLIVAGLVFFASLATLSLVLIGLGLKLFMRFID
jgi:uncharacterized membrane protein